MFKQKSVIHFPLQILVSERETSLYYDNNYLESKKRDIKNVKIYRFVAMVY
jgi:hypothetical protein